MVELARELRPHLRAGRWLLAAVVGCTLLAAPLEMLGVGLLLPMLGFLGGTPERKQQLLEGEWLRWIPTLLPDQGHTVYFAVFCGLIVGALILKGTVIYVGARMNALLTSRVGHNLRSALYRRLMGAPLPVFDEHKAGHISAVFTMETVRTLNAMDYVLGFAQRATIALFFVAGIIWISWQVAVALVVMLVVMSLVTGWIHRRLKNMGSERSTLYQQLGSVLVEAFAGVRVVRATHSQEEITQRFEKLSREIGGAERRATRMVGGLQPVGEILGVMGAMGMLVGAYHFLIVPGILPATELMYVGFLLIRLLPLASQLQGFTGQLAYNLAGVREVQKWLRIAEYPARPFGKVPFKEIRQGLVFDAISFRYPNGTVALDGVSFRVGAGRTVALVGASGSGKSTLASLLIRLRQPTGGMIRVDDVDYWEFDPAAWHRGLGVVEQEAFLFHESVRDNIRMGVPEATEEAMNRALKTAHLDDLMRTLPAGLETVVGERGTMLSGGQRQRLAIARALVRDPKLLILDEATSALDNVSERQVQAALDAAREGRTTVVIAHRLSTIRTADSIVVLEKGKVVQEGTWESLSTQPGHFQRLLAAARDGHLTEALG
jgi:ABC-type multidrug transport system fused ATPase/permease subunit